MSEVKLYAFESDDFQNYPYRPATADEIKAAHPKCGTCDFMGNEDFKGDHGCVFVASPLYGMKVDPVTEYCRYHTPKEQIHE